MNDQRFRHILKLSCGITIELLLDEATGFFNCEWSELPSRKTLHVIEREYMPWRNGIIAAWAQRTGKKVMVLDL
jgi:hypothetical protein